MRFAKVAKWSGQPWDRCPSMKLKWSEAGPALSQSLKKACSSLAMLSWHEERAFLRALSVETEIGAWLRQPFCIFSG